MAVLLWMQHVCGKELRTPIPYWKWWPSSVENHQQRWAQWATPSVICRRSCSILRITLTFNITFICSFIAAATLHLSVTTCWLKFIQMAPSLWMLKLQNVISENNVASAQLSTVVYVQLAMLNYEENLVTILNHQPQMWQHSNIFIYLMKMDDNYDYMIAII